jgi:Ran GTPase-activating protein (RanGAP) involved in mRNA processing and transport
MHLDLKLCKIGDNGVKKVCHPLFESDSELELIDLSGNDLTRRGAKHIADFVRDC